MSLAAQAPGGPSAMPVEAVPVHMENLVIEINAVGTLLANETVTIRPEDPGRIAVIQFNEGDGVSKGDVLVTLDDKEYRARLDESKASLKLQQLNYDRAKQLYEKKLSSQQDYDHEAALLEEARARLALNEEQLRKTVLRAPFSGVLGLRQVSPGDYVKEGDAIVDLTDLDSLKLDFQIPEIHLTELAVGQHLSLQVDAHPGDSFTGEVYAIAPRLDVTSRSVPVRARVANPDGRLRPGMFARVNLRIAEHDDALLVPEESIWPIGQDKFVYRVVDGKVTLTKVALGYRRKGEVEVLSGLTADDMVVTAGQMKIREGAAVTVINQPPATQQ
jgi:membrane fusion protein (multidrug efflux system)